MNIHSYQALGANDSKQCFESEIVFKQIQENRRKMEETTTEKKESSFLYGAHVNARNRKQFNLPDSPRFELL